MNKFKENIRPLCWLVSIPIVNVFYALLNNSSRGAFNLVTTIDDKIPFIQYFILPYMSWYAFMFLTMAYICVKDKKTYYKTLITLDLGLIFCYIIYFIFQTTVPRPELYGSDLFTKAVAIMYKTDSPYNCFPSIHVLTSYLMVKAIYKSKARNPINFIIISFCATAIIISTLFIKQHVIADIVSGVLVADILFDIVFKVNEEKFLKYIKKLCSVITIKNKLEV